jgi:uncharacterized protein YkwD
MIHGSKGALTLVFVAMALLAGPARATDPEVLAMERRMWELLNTERNSRALPTLEFDEPLSAVARAHSLDMLTQEFFAHESPTTGTPFDRFFHASIRASATGENIARNDTVAAGHQRLMESPGHRANILSTDYDHVGIGIVRQGNSLWMTQNFAKLLKRVDVPTLPGRLVRAINSLRAKSRLQPLVPHPRLSVIAAQVATRMNNEQRLLARLPGQLLESSGPPSRQFWSRVSLDETPRKALENRDFNRSKLNAVGIGVVENRSREKGLGMLWVVILLAEIR